jgi:isoquinoline 1-oxidoreductase beta subunit
MDVRLPGMVYAAIARAPVAGARVLEYDDRKAREAPGVIAVGPKKSSVRSQDPCDCARINATKCPP